MPAAARRNVLLAGVALLLLAAAAYLYFSRAGAGAELPREYTIDGVCLACRQEARVTASMRHRQPLECPRCGQRAFYSWFYCEKCRKRVIPNLQPAPGGGPPRIPIIATCPLCGTEVGPYAPEEPAQQPVGDAPLPAWPVD